MAKYKSPFSVARRQTVVVDSDDPRAGGNLEKTRSRLGSDIIVKQSLKPITLEEALTYNGFIILEPEYVQQYTSPRNSYTYFPYIDNKEFLDYQMISDSSGNIYTYGVSDYYSILPNNGLSNIPVIKKHNSSGKLLWFKGLDFSQENISTTYNSNEYRGVASVQVDSSKNVYLIGSDQTDLSPSNKPFTTLMKLNPYGEIIWKRNLVNTKNPIEGYADGDGSLPLITIGDDNNIYISIAYSTYSSYDPAYHVIMKYDSSGNLQWQKRVWDGKDLFDIRTAGSTNKGYPHVTICDKSSNFYIFFPILQVLEFRNFFYDYDVIDSLMAIKIDPNGNIIWKKIFNELTFVDEECKPVMDSEENIYIPATDYVDLNYYPVDNTILKIDKDGNVVWRKAFYITQPFQTQDNLAIDNSDNLYTISSYQSIRIDLGYTTRDLMLRKYDSSFTKIFENYIYALGTSSDTVPAINTYAGQIFLYTSGPQVSIDYTRPDNNPNGYRMYMNSSILSIPSDGSGIGTYNLSPTINKDYTYNINATLEYKNVPGAPLPTIHGSYLNKTGNFENYTGYGVNIDLAPTFYIENDDTYADSTSLVGVSDLTAYETTVKF